MNDQIMPRTRRASIGSGPTLTTPHRQSWFLSYTKKGVPDNPPTRRFPCHLTT